MPTFKDTYLSFDSWTTWDHALSQHKQLLTTGGHLCKVLFKNQQGNPVGTEDSPIVITSWDSSGSVTTSAYKKVWKSTDSTALYVDPDSVKVWVDNTEIIKTYDSSSIMYDNEFYVRVANNLVDEADSVAIHFNPGYDVNGHTIEYLYTTRGKQVSIYNLQSGFDSTNYRSPYGYTQYLDTSAVFRGQSKPHTVLISFPPPPAFDTRFANLGIFEEWKARAWTVGDVVLHENDIIYRVHDNRWFEITDYEPNIITYKDAPKLLTQSFTLVQLGPNDVVKDFPLI